MFSRRGATLMLLMPVEARVPKTYPPDNPHSWTLLLFHTPAWWPPAPYGSCEVQCLQWRKLPLDLVTCQWQGTSTVKHQWVPRPLLGNEDIQGDFPCGLLAVSGSPVWVITARQTQLLPRLEWLDQQRHLVHVLKEPLGLGLFPPALKVC